MGRGFAVILSLFQSHPEAPADLLAKERELEKAEPEINPWACSALLLLCVGLMAVTAEFLVDSVDFIREEGSISEEFFGVVLLPILSWSADGAVTLAYFACSTMHIFFKYKEAGPPTTIAEARAIELSIQFLLLWTPFLVLLGWLASKALSFLFDLLEVTVLVGSCFLVNYVTADSKTNWAEGTMMISLYIMIALSAWYYPGQTELRIMDACVGIAGALVSGGGPE